MIIGTNPVLFEDFFMIFYGFFKDEQKKFSNQANNQAKIFLISQALSAVHIDSLAARLKDPRIKKIVEPILIGAIDSTMAESEDFRFCIDLGLVSLIDGTPSISNPIYTEAFPHLLLMAFLQRVATGGALIEHEYAPRRGRLDLFKTKNAS